MLPNISTIQATDLIVFWIAGSGLENMNDLPTWNYTYLEYLQGLYKIWSKGFDRQGFFDKIQVRVEKIIWHLVMRQEQGAPKSRQGGGKDQK
jgi:hypothetical protein